MTALLEAGLTLTFLSISESRTPVKLSSYINLLALCRTQNTGYTGSITSISTAGLCLALKDRTTDSKKFRIKGMLKTHSFEE